MVQDDIKESADHSHHVLPAPNGMRHCGADLGHVFDDGGTADRPALCINSASLKLDPEPAKPAADAAKPAEKTAK